MGYRLKFKLPESWTREGLNRKREAMADELLRQTVDRIEAGGDPDAPFAPLAMPRANGGTGAPLATDGFLSALSRFKTDRTFGVESTHVAAKRLFLGSTGKGGTLPPITPKKPGGVLSWISGGIRRFARKVEHPPRRFLRLTAANVKSLARVLAGRK